MAIFGLMIKTLGITALMACSCGMATERTSKDACCSTGAQGATTGLSCTLTPEEMRQRKETVLASLKAQVVDRTELVNGFAYRFAGSDAVVDELTEFIKTERACCSFFSFVLTVAGDKTFACLQLTGPPGAKKMIVQELGL
jgi:hypothetical protein